MIFGWLKRRRERAEAAILNALRPGDERSGAWLDRMTGIGSGRLYVILADLEGRGILTSRWEDGPYPRRRLYSRVRP